MTKKQKGTRRIKIINKFGNPRVVKVPERMLFNLRNAGADRFKNGISRRVPNDSELMRLACRTDSFKNLLEEIRKRPTWEDLS